MKTDLLDWLLKDEYIYQYDVYNCQVWKSEKMIAVIHEDKGLRLLFSNMPLDSEKQMKNMIIRLLVRQEER